MTPVAITFDEKVNHFDGAIRDERGALHRPDLPAGTACWVKGMDGEIAALRFTCPCGCGLIGSTPVSPNYGGNWTWNGSKEKPTLAPSILFTLGCPKTWHGYLTDGVFKSV